MWSKPSRRYDLYQSPSSQKSCRSATDNVPSGNIQNSQIPTFQQSIMAYNPFQDIHIEYPVPQTICCPSDPPSGIFQLSNFFSKHLDVIIEEVNAMKTQLRKIQEFYAGGVSQSGEGVSQSGGGVSQSGGDDGFWRTKEEERLVIVQILESLGYIREGRYPNGEKCINEIQFAELIQQAKYIYNQQHQISEAEIEIEEEEEQIQQLDNYEIIKQNIKPSSNLLETVGYHQNILNKNTTYRKTGMVESDFINLSYSITSQASNMLKSKIINTEGQNQIFSSPEFPLNQEKGNTQEKSHMQDQEQEQEQDQDQEEQPTSKSTKGDWEIIVGEAEGDDQGYNQVDGEWKPGFLLQLRKVECSKIENEPNLPPNSTRIHSQIPIQPPYIDENQCKKKLQRLLLNIYPRLLTPHKQQSPQNNKQHPNISNSSDTSSKKSNPDSDVFNTRIAAMKMKKNRNQYKQPNWRSKSAKSSKSGQYRLPFGVLLNARQQPQE